MKDCDVLILTDLEEGHLFPLFKLASNLEKNGYNVCFAGVADTMEIVKEHGFNSYVIFENLFPKGYIRNLKKNKARTNSVSANYLEQFFREFEALMSSLKPKLIFSSFFFVLEALIIHYTFGVKQIIFHTLFPALDGDSHLSLGERSSRMFIKKVMALNESIISLFMDFLDKHNLSFENFEEVVAPLKAMAQVMLCPKELDINNSFQSKNDFYLGPCITTPKKIGQDLFLTSLKNRTSEKIIYASMGSQTKEYPEKSLKFFNLILECMKSASFKDYHLVLSLGSEIEGWRLTEVPDNASVLSWVPQLEVLQNSSLAVIHGGLGSVKECAYYGVPMLAIPMGRDQNDNAQRIDHHNLGKKLDIDQANVTTLAEKITCILENEEIKKSVLKMKDVFHNANNSQKEAELVRSLLS